MSSTGWTTWESWRPADGNILLIVNSPEEQTDEIVAVCEEIERHAGPERLHAVAPAASRAVLLARGWRPEHVLEPGSGAVPLELNYFLESAPALQWIHQHRITTVVGSIPHGLYNDEVKDVFERRVALVLANGYFVAHALPHRDLYHLRLHDLLVRMARAKKAEAYVATCRATIEDLFARWQAHGRPAIEDGTPFDVERTIVARRLSPAVLSFDEVSAIPISTVSTAASTEEFIGYAESVFQPAVGHLEPTVIRLEQRVAELAPLEQRVAELAPLERRVAELAPLEQRVAELAPLERRVAELAPLERRVAELAPLEQQVAELPRLERRVVELIGSVELQQREIDRRDDLLRELQAERVEAVAIRDRRIVELQAQYDYATRGWRRFFSRRK